MPTSLRHIFKWFEKLDISQGQMIEMLIVVAAVSAGFFISRQIGRKISSPLRHKFEETSERFFDVRYTTLVTLVITSIVLWGAGFAYEGLKLKVQIIEDANLIILAWIAIRSLTHIIDRSLLSRFIANVLWAVSALYITGHLKAFSKTLMSYSYTIGKINFSLHTFVMGIIIFSILFWVTSLFAHIVGKYLNSNKKMNRSQKALVMKIVKVVLYTVAFMVGFQVVGLDLTTITVFGGAIGFGIGFGLQKVFSNLISGIIILLDKSVQPGDTIAVAGTYGEVKKLDARYVSVVTRDGKKHLIPNENLISERVENWSYIDNEIRLHIPVSVSYESDLELVRDLMIEAATEGSERVLKTKPPNCLLMGFGESSVDFELRIWISDPQNGCEAPQSAVLFKVWEKFRENNIKIPYPQRDVHMISDKKGFFG